MKRVGRLLCCVVLALAVPGSLSQADEAATTSADVVKELDAYWAEVSRCVGEGDFKGYAATCHPEGVLVSGVKQTSYPLTKALERWQPGFDDTRAKRMKASVQFRFSQRLHDDTTAHETGIFRYASSQDGEEVVQYVNFEGMLRKTDAGWKIVMEYQKSMASEEDWKSLAPNVSASR